MFSIYKVRGLQLIALISLVLLHDGNTMYNYDSTAEF